MPPRAVRMLLVPAVAVGCARLIGPDGFWPLVPLALALAGTGPGAREGFAAGALVLLAGGIAAAPPLAPALLAGPASLVALTRVRVRLERERDAMRRWALRDPLTGLANRRALADRLRHEVARHGRRGESFVVLALDLDGFKPINDRFGHDAGDEVLRDVATALSGAVRGQDTVARMGGDEFCIVAPDTDEAGGEHLSLRVRDALLSVTTGVSGLSASVGIAVFPADGREPSALLAAADEAVIAAKRRRYAGRRRRRAA